jgi:hypothetical protein
MIVLISSFVFGKLTKLIAVECHVFPVRAIRLPRPDVIITNRDSRTGEGVEQAGSD